MRELDLRGFECKVNGVQHRLLKQLLEVPQGSQALYNQTTDEFKGLYSLQDFITEGLTSLSAEGYISYADTLWAITVQGRALANFLDMKSRSKSIPTVAGSRDYQVPEGSYSGAELQATVHRRGAYDFLNCPSRYGEMRVQHPTAYIADLQEKNYVQGVTLT